MTRAAHFFLILIGLCMGLAGQARATELACKPGVVERKFAQTLYLMPDKNLHQLRGELEVWATERQISRGAVGSYDPKTRLHTWTLLMGPEDKGVSLTARFATNSRIIEVGAENVCWEEQSDWRPWWDMLTKELVRAGYQPAAPSSASQR